MTAPATTPVLAGSSRASVGGGGDGGMEGWKRGWGKRKKKKKRAGIDGGLFISRRLSPSAVVRVLERQRRQVSLVYVCNPLKSVPLMFPSV